MFFFFEVGNSSLVHIDNYKKYIIVLGEGPTKGPTITAEVEYYINFTR